MADSLEHEGTKAPVLTAFTRAQYWVSAIGGLVIAGSIAGFSALAYLDRYATTTSVERVEARQNAMEKDLAERRLIYHARLATLEAQQKSMESEYHDFREQLWRIADRVGARRVDTPTRTYRPSMDPAP